ncbi:calcium/sodium antiporter [Pelagicoccus sp. SDUM812002]|uniref:calcium/sodium antiporter n=1 Tax=Pelagicoccus sp. SDUM812002 TaxID=3041266 RepID=UPI00280DF566|nr:calcium/sodium antiporter [Pelagicoccus sp. SDUM812002]MDQ8186611.1 calcium/sodium antiporter [Pelagicoccus sp. SDUM812002]
MLLPIIALVIGLIVLIWSADRFIDGASGVAGHFGMPPLLIGIIIVGFGTSAPELVVSAFAAAQDNPGLALGNAFGSNIANIALILGVTTLIAPITVRSSILKKELPILSFATIVVGYLIWDLDISRNDGIIMLVVFAGIMAWTTREGMKGNSDILAQEFTEDLNSKKSSLGMSFFWLILGLVLLLASSRSMVWGSVEIATQLGVSDLVIGLTIVAVGTSLPELASSIAAARKGEHDIVIGNIIGSNMFNTLAVVGIAAVIRPFQTVSEVLTRDLPSVAILTVALFFVCYRKGGEGRVTRIEGTLLVIAFAGYNSWVFLSQ